VLLQGMVGWHNCDARHARPAAAQADGLQAAAQLQGMPGAAFRAAPFMK